PPAKEDPPKPPATAPEALALILEAAGRQGTGKFTGEKAVTRFFAVFDPVVLHSPKGDRVQSRSTEAFSLPPAGGTLPLIQSRWIQDGKEILLGRDSRSGWIRAGTEPARRFLDPEGRDRQEVADLEDRTRMLRMALRVFFLGNLGGGPVVTLREPEAMSLPVGLGGEPRKVRCRVLDREADPGAGEPAMRIYLAEDALLPVAAVLYSGDRGASSFLLTFDYDAEETRKPEDLPQGVKVPNWCELFELPAKPGEKPALRIQAGVQRLEIHPLKVPDSLFAFPR
ncbi:MAG: hypothetical protein HUU06_06370, partial [Planctomycetaceae bacterium]|nr:hypothetical protein [Planctomycetaceae bacterium]